MKLRNVLLSFLANLKVILLSLLVSSGSLALGGGLIYARLVRDLMRRIVCLSLRRLGEESANGQVSAAEIYFFIWTVEKVARRHNLKFPTFNFSARKGMLASSRLTYILRRMIASGWIAVEGNNLVLTLQNEPQLADLAEEALLLKICIVINEVAEQWNEKDSKSQLVRFGKLFR